MSIKTEEVDEANTEINYLEHKNDLIKEINMMINQNCTLCKYYLKLIYNLQTRTNIYIYNIIYVSSKDTSNVMHVNIFINNLKNIISIISLTKEMLVDINNLLLNIKKNVDFYIKKLELNLNDYNINLVSNNLFWQRSYDLAYTNLYQDKMFYCLNSYLKLNFKCVYDNICIKLSNDNIYVLGPINIISFFPMVNNNISDFISDYKNYDQNHIFDIINYSYLLDTIIINYNDSILYNNMFYDKLTYTSSTKTNKIDKLIKMSKTLDKSEYQNFINNYKDLLIDCRLDILNLIIEKKDEFNTLDKPLIKPIINNLVHHNIFGNKFKIINKNIYKSKIIWNKKIDLPLIKKISYDAIKDYINKKCKQKIDPCDLFFVPIQLIQYYNNVFYHNAISFWDFIFELAKMNIALLSINPESIDVDLQLSIRLFLLSSSNINQLEILINMINNSLIFESDIVKKYNIPKKFSNYINDDADGLIMYNNNTTNVEYIVFYLNILIEYSKNVDKDI
jgi:hypothetical protein